MLLQLVVVVLILQAAALLAVLRGVGLLQPHLALLELAVQVLQMVVVTHDMEILLQAAAVLV
jgi:hypothetical protein